MFAFVMLVSVSLWFPPEGGSNESPNVVTVGGICQG